MLACCVPIIVMMLLKRELERFDNIIHHQFRQSHHLSTRSTGIWNHNNGLKRFSTAKFPSSAAVVPDGARASTSSQHQQPETGVRFASLRACCSIMVWSRDNFHWLTVEKQTACFCATAQKASGNKFHALDNAMFLSL